MADLLPDLAAALGGAYRFEKELGGGGMSRVYLAEELGLGRRVVIKLLPPELGAGVSVDRFRRETQLAASLQHPHIVPLLTAGAAGDLLYYTMPFVEGESLRARLARETELPVRDAVRILREVADALAYAHGRGVVHRDIKPDNVLLSGGHALVADFGIAKALIRAAGSSGLTSVGIAIGTPTYMAPEQAAGDPNVDHRADLYSLGAMAYEMLGGRPPFSGMSPQQVLAAHVAEPVEDLTKHRSNLPTDLAELVMWCLEKNPADRPQTAGEVLQALDAIATPTGGTRPARFGRRPRLAGRRIAVTVLVAGGLVGGWALLRGRSPSALDPDRVAVAPFEVLDPALTLWREGLVDVLSRSLDGAGPLRTVSPTLVVKRWSGHADATSAQVLGRETGARTVVYGQLLGAGPDSVRLTATVLDAASGASVGDIELRGASARIDRLADSLTVAVLRTLGRTRAIGLVRGAGLGSTSLPALKAFLQGEQFLRRSQYDSALVYNQKAIALDSTFTLALSHACMAAGWQHSGGDSLTRIYALAAGRLNHGLAPRESLLVLADSLTAVVYNGPQWVGSAWWAYGKRLLATLDEAVRRYPGDPELWYTLGDARFHAGVAAGIGRPAALEAFDRAIALDSSFSPARGGRRAAVYRGVPAREQRGPLRRPLPPARSAARPAHGERCRDGPAARLARPEPAGPRGRARPLPRLRGNDDPDDPRLRGWAAAAGAIGGRVAAGEDPGSLGRCLSRPPHGCRSDDWDRIPPALRRARPARRGAAGERGDGVPGMGAIPQPGHRRDRRVGGRAS